MATMQTMRNWVPWLAVLACAFPASTVVADEPLREPLRVWAIGLPNGYVIMEQQAQVLHVSAEDVARGMAEVRGGSRLVFTLHSPGGYTVNFRARGELIQSTWIGGIGRTVEIDSSGGTVVQRNAAAGRHIVAIDYRFLLAPDAVPGTYPWPFEVAVRRPLSGDGEQPSGVRSQMWADKR